MTNFVDSDVLVLAFIVNPKQDKCYGTIKEGEVLINTLTLLECYAKISTIRKDKESTIRTIRSLYKADNIKIVDFDKNLFFEALKRCNTYQLKISDLVHYTTAVINGCSAIVSYDRHFDNLEIKRIEPK